MLRSLLVLKEQTTRYFQQERTKVACALPTHGRMSDKRHAAHMNRKTEAQNSKSRDKRVHGHISDKRHAAHMKGRTEALNEQSCDKRVAQDDRHTVVATLDLQIVLLDPRPFASMSYFKTKLARLDVSRHNFSTKTAPCSLWHGG